MRRMQHQFFSVEEVGKFLHEKKNLFFLSQVIFSNKNCKSWSLNFAEKFLVKRDAKTIFFSKNKRMARIYFVIYKERKKNCELFKRKNAALIPQRLKRVFISLCIVQLHFFYKLCLLELGFTVVLENRALLRI